jgi:serine/threonine protein phosphatase PrpC
MCLDFEVAAGTVAGSTHRKGVPHNRQDDYCVQISPTTLTAIIADGCSTGGVDSSRSSKVVSKGSTEVGASLAVRLLSDLIQVRVASGQPVNGDLLEAARRDLLDRLWSLARSMGSISEIVDRYLLFTLVGVVLTKEEATFFALGDGVVIVNDERYILNAEEGNRPLYLGYALTGSSLTDDDPTKLDFRIIRRIATVDLDHFLIGTDGINDWLAKAARSFPGTDQPLGDVSQFWTEDRYFNLEVAVERQLNLAARDWYRTHPDGSRSIEGGLLPDDTTLVVGRRVLTLAGDG